MVWTLSKTVDLGETGLVSADVLKVSFQEMDGTLSWKDYTNATSNVTLREIGNSGRYQFQHTQQADDTPGSLVFHTEAVGGGSDLTGVTVLAALAIGVNEQPIIGADGDTLETLSDQIDTILATPGATVESVLTSSSSLTLYRGDELTITITGLGDISTRSRLYFTIKQDTDDVDAESLLQVEETDGLKYLNGSDDVTASDASITVDDENDGGITVIVKGASAAQLQVTPDAVADVQWLDSDATPQPHTPKKWTTVAIQADVTRTTS